MTTAKLESMPEAGPILAAIAAALAVVMEDEPRVAWRVRSVGPQAAGPWAEPWGFVGRVQLMEGRRWVQGRRYKA